jgi:hypothetical protein
MINLQSRGITEDKILQLNRFLENMNTKITVKLKMYRST